MAGSFPSAEKTPRFVDQDVHSLVSDLAYMKQRAEIYTALQIPKPDGMDDEIEKITKRILDMRRDALAARKKEIENRLESLKSQEEKRSDLRAELDKLNSELGK